MWSSTRREGQRGPCTGERGQTLQSRVRSSRSRLTSFRLRAANRCRSGVFCATDFICCSKPNTEDELAVTQKKFLTAQSAAFACTREQLQIDRLANGSNPAG